MRTKVVWFSVCIARASSVNSDARTVSRRSASAIIHDMATIKLNGEEREIPNEWTLADLLNDLQINNRYCAVERNKLLVPREQHSDCRLDAGDEIEVVTLVGGG